MYNAHSLFRLKGRWILLPHLPQARKWIQLFWSTSSTTLHLPVPMTKTQLKLKIALGFSYSNLLFKKIQEFLLWVETVIPYSAQ